MPTSRRQAWKLGLLLMLRVTLSASVLLVAYYLIPTRSSAEGSVIPWLILQFCVFGVVVGVQLPAIVKAKYPGIRAIEAMAILVPVYLLMFARIYLANSLNNPSAFTEPLDHSTALYFTVTVFATVGFGDIFAQTNNVRLLVTVQMLLNLVVLGFVIRLLTSAARRGVARRGGEPELSDSGRPSV